MNMKITRILRKNSQYEYASREESEDRKGGNKRGPKGKLVTQGAVF